MKNLVKIAGAIAACALVGSAIAAPRAASSAWSFSPVVHNYYIGGAIGFGEGTSSSASMGFSYGLNGGYRFNSNMAAEVGFEGLPNNSSNTGNSTTKNSYVFYGVARASLPVAPKFSLIGKGGLAIVHNSTSGTGGSDSSSTKMGFALGGGASYHLNSQVDLNGMLMGTMGGTGTNTLAMLFGVSYNFGQ